MKKNESVSEFTTGLAALDELIGHVVPGDNFVWHVDSMENFAAIAHLFVSGAATCNHSVVYFRWSSNRNILDGLNDKLRKTVTECRLQPEAGFENFITQMHTAIEEAAPGTVFLFDLLSDLRSYFRAEQSLENFFVLTCPQILQLKHLGVFPILRDRHTFSTAHPIQETTQIDAELFRYNDLLHLHMLKVDGRHTDFMYAIHRWEGEELIPLLNSVETVTALHQAQWAGLQSASYRMILDWDRTFMTAEEQVIAATNNEVDEQQIRTTLKKVLPLIITREPRMLSLFEKYFSLKDVVYVWKRTIGSGIIGGKAAGMLLSRAIVQADTPDVAAEMEPHDSFFIASDVYYDFLIKNNCWRIRKKQQCSKTLFEDSSTGQKRILNGEFPTDIMRRFSDMLSYFGQEPIIVRSSSLLEDAYGSAFAGKYESVFCSNQGTREDRMNAFLNAIRQVYASTMSKDALAYREKRNLLSQDEQMAILVQRVSGTRCGSYFYPHLAGVGLSYNPYIWNPQIDPEAGVLRLVVGLGTRAVDRHDDDHARVVALNLPHQPPIGDGSTPHTFAQRKVDFVDLGKNKVHSRYFVDIIQDCAVFPVNRLAAVDTDVLKKQKETGHKGRTPWVVDFSALFSKTPFAPRMRKMLAALRDAYESEVEIEFTATLLSNDEVRLNIVQCRPFQIDVTDERLTETTIPPVSECRTIMKANGAILGKSRRHRVDRIIYVVPASYSALPEQDKYLVARLIGRLTHLPIPADTSDEEDFNAVLIGPGRWGTRMPSLGVPVTSGDIGKVAVMCELDIMHEGLIPDLSLGTHFFHELVEANILYIGYFNGRPDNFLDMPYLLNAENQLDFLLPDESKWRDVVRVIHFSADTPLFILADLHQQQAQLFVAPA